MNWISSRFVSLVRMIYSPKVAFTRDLKGPSYLIPFFVLGVFFVLLSLLQSSLNLQWVHLQMEASGTPTEQLTTNLELMRKSNSLTLVFVPLFLLLKWTLFALLLWLTGQVIFEVIDFHAALTVVAYSYVSILFRDAFFYLVLILRGSNELRRADGLHVAIGLNLLFPSIPLPWAALAGNINIFEIWYVFLLVIGLSKLTASSWQRALAVVLPNWFFVALIQLGTVSLGLTFQSTLQK